MPNTLRIATRLEYFFAQPTDILLQIEAAAIPEQTIVSAHLEVSPSDHFARVPAQDGIGERIWLRHQGEFVADYQAEVTIGRKLSDIGAMPAVPLHQLPGETVQYLMDSRYCPATRFDHFVHGEFGGLTGGAAVLAMRDWIDSHLEYVSGSSDSNTTALDSFVERRGVCRDFAHTLITFVRTAGIPARFASVYAPDVKPQDFHAVAEVFLASGVEGQGEWHLIDPTGMAHERDMAKIGIGRDAADVSFLTFYGTAEMRQQRITVARA